MKIIANKIIFITKHYFFKLTFFFIRRQYKYKYNLLSNKKLLDKILIK